MKNTSDTKYILYADIFRLIHTVFLIVGYKKSICSKGMATAGRKIHVERNQAMIRENDVCIFYYDENYQPSRRKNSRRDLFDYQPKSGTAVAYAYAVQKKKRIYNLCEK